jgi:hypothetical protein
MNLMRADRYRLSLKEQETRVQTPPVLDENRRLENEDALKISYADTFARSP